MIARVSHMSPDGIWLTLEEKELFLSFDNFPWFKNVPVSAVQHVERLNANHLYWSDLDIDLSLELIEQPERFPLIAKLAVTSSSC